MHMSLPRVAEAQYEHQQHDAQFEHYSFFPAVGALADGQCERSLTISR